MASLRRVGHAPRRRRHGGGTSPHSWDPLRWAAGLRPEELLPIFADISVTLAALSGVAGVIGTVGDARDVDLRARRVLLRDVAINGLVAALLSLVPLLFEDAWRVASAAAALFWLGIFLVSSRQIRLLERRLRRVWIAPVITALGLALFAWNVVAPDAASPMRYAAGVLCLLGIAGLCFVFAVFVSAPD